MKKIEVYHQCGFRDKWNYDIYCEDGVGDGFIFAPKMERIKKLNKLPEEVLKKSFFDSQFYCPTSKEEKFSQFDFFPNKIADGYSTSDFQELAYLSANRCIDFQVENEFKILLIPTIVYDETPSKYIDIIRELYIEPYIKKIVQLKNNTKKVLLTVAVKDSQLLDEKYRDRLLNVITSYNEIDGVYLVPIYSSASKRIKDFNNLYNMLCFIDILKQNDMYVHLAYSDIEGIIFTLADIDSVSIGTYENLRRFELKNFKEKDKNQNYSYGGPKRRIYSNKLYQWIDYDYLGALKRLKNFKNLFEENKYVSFNVPGCENWNFKFPDLYKHYLMSLFNQYKKLPCNYNDRYDFLCNELSRAMEINENIEGSGILFDINSNGDHLPKWITAINMFNKMKKGE